MTDKFNILDELKENGAVALLNANNRNYFSVPDNYFDDLAPNTLRHIFIKSLPVINPFAVPSLYFENLPDIILDKTQVRKNLSFSIEEKNLYVVPDGYFNSLAENILKKRKRCLLQVSIYKIKILHIAYRVFFLNTVNF